MRHKVSNLIEALKFFFKREYISQDYLFWNNLPGELIKFKIYLENSNFAEKLCVSNSTRESYSFQMANKKTLM